MLPNCPATQFSRLALRRNHSTPRSDRCQFPYVRSNTQLRFSLFRAQKAEQKAEDIQHALNLMLNLGFERFHTALTIDGAVHEFELGTVRNLPAPDEIHWPVIPKRTRNRRIVLWRTMFPGRHHYASVFNDAEFRSLPKHLETGSELRNLLEAAIERIPMGRPLLVKGGPVRNR